MTEPIAWTRAQRWQVIFSDPAFWRVGIYSPPEASRREVTTVERHDCPELFLLIEGRMTLVVVEADAVRELVLEPGVPVVVTTPHGAYCPDGPHTGIAFVVERTEFSTDFAPLAP